MDGLEKKEIPFENKLIDYLTKIGGSKQWEFVPEIKNTADLWANFKRILEQNNQDQLDQPLSDQEFEQIKVAISNLNTPYEAGQFLYGVGGRSQVEVDLDNGQHKFLTVFDQDQIGGGMTQYQIVHQIQRKAVIPGKRDRRFDTTLLINGLPIIQIEEKADGHIADEALNQMHQYIDEGQYTGIFSTLQILVAMTPHDIKYMAITDVQSFNKDFAFRWQREKDNKPVYDWHEFANRMLSIPMAHQMATNFMILDGNKFHPNIKVMRPYQVYATKRVIQKIRQHDFERDNDQRIGYIWHATGSGKTISSFKAAWLASRLPNVDKVVFLVDRVALTDQTVDDYKAYDPDSDIEGNGGVVTDTANKFDLRRKLRAKGSTVIVTSTQKMASLVRKGSKKESKPLSDKHVVFIVDEAHRSTSGEMLDSIKKVFPKSAWVGYTGTPVFSEKAKPSQKTEKAKTTHDIFGDPLAIYTIKNAIADGNVLGFKVDFENTIPKKTLESQYLPAYYKKYFPQLTDEQIKRRIADMSPEDMDDAVSPTVYDNNEAQVKSVVDNIIKYWPQRSRNGEYNALLTTHVGGREPSTPMAMMYYHEFMRRNAELKHPLKIAITFSMDNRNDDDMVANNRSLHEAIQDYNKIFGTSFEDKDVKAYTADVVSRLNRTAGDKKYLDLVIVVDQLLTGFDAPQLNTLYVDRTLKGANLIQAYSRTNRVFDNQTKPFGHVVNYRWPANSKKLMDEALAIYANAASANVQTEIAPPNEPGEIIVPSYEEIISTLKKVVSQLARENITAEFSRIPQDSDMAAQDQMYVYLRQYNKLVAEAKQCTEYAEETPESFVKKIGMTLDQENELITVLAKRLLEHIARRDSSSGDPIKIDMRVEHVQEITVNYSYLLQLVAEMMNALHEGNKEVAANKSKEIKDLAAQLDDQAKAQQINDFTDDAMSGGVPLSKYPYDESDIPEMLTNHQEKTVRERILVWKKKWGVVDIKDSQKINEVIYKHVEGEDDLNVDGTEDLLVREAASVYKSDAEDEEIKGLPRIRYRNAFRSSLKDLADAIKGNYYK